MLYATGIFVLRSWQCFFKIFQLEVCFLIIILIVVMQISQESLKCSVIVYIHSIQLLVFGFPFKAPS